MSQVEYIVDRSKWRSGPWDGEPDRIEWKTDAGLPALMVRQRNHGAWCGYVAVAPDHSLHGKSLVDCGQFEVHGDITYSKACHGDVCHVPEPCEPDNVWWLGFDCAHIHDTTPKPIAVPSYGLIFGGFDDLGSPGGDDENYRDVAYVQAECESLAKQIVEVDR